MKGNIRIQVSTKKLRYELTLRRNITIIQGDSATGKTILIQILNDYLAERTGPGTEVICDKKCVVLTGDTEGAIIRLKSLSEAVVFADEQEKFIYTETFAKAVLKSDCYFVLIVRDGLHMLPYSVNEIYCLKNSGYYQNTRQVYNSMHQIYPENREVKDMKADICLAEDSNSGYEMYNAIYRKSGIKCISANGKSNIARFILEHNEEGIFAIADGAAFGADMQNAMHALAVNHRSFLWTPESFEYLILKSGIIQESGLRDILENPGKHIESREFVSWERYFTYLLETITRNSIYTYKKSKLNKNYLTKGNLEKIKEMFPDVSR